MHDNAERAKPWQGLQPAINAMATPKIFSWIRDYQAAVGNVGHITLVKFVEFLE
jgi:hypothetical protein